MDKKESKITQVLTKDKIGRRKAIKKLALGTAFAVPVVASFSMNGMIINEAKAYASNMVPIEP